MHRHVTVILATILFAAVAFAQPAIPADAFQVRYAANLAIGDSFVNLLNTGAAGGSGLEPMNICANVYVLDPDQELVACCTCPLTANSLKSLSARDDLINNTLTPGIPTSISIKLLASTGTCNAAVVPVQNLTAGLRAWGTTPHVTPSGVYTVTETEFLNSPLSQAEYLRLTIFCGFIQANGSGYGICGSCALGARGASHQ